MGCPKYIEYALRIRALNGDGIGKSWPHKYLFNAEWKSCPRIPFKVEKYSFRSFTVLRTRLYNFNKKIENITYYKNVFSSLVRETHEFRLMEGLNGKHTLLARMCKSIGGKQISWYG